MSKQCFCLGLMLTLFVGCREGGDDSGAAWSDRQEIAKSSDSLSAGLALHRWNGSLLALGGDEGTYAARVLAEDGKSWKTIATTNPGWPAVDADGDRNRLLISRATLSNDRLDVGFSVASFSSGQFVTNSMAALGIDKGVLFPNAQNNLEMTIGGRPAEIAFASSVVEEEEIRVPYCIRAMPVERRGRQTGYRGDLAVSANGVFASADAGRTWRFEPIINRYAESPTVCRTTGFYYYFAKGGLGTPFELWASRCPTKTMSWNQPETLNKTVARKLSERLHAIGENDIVHLCWLDARHEKTRSSLSRPRAENYEVVYCNRRDADSKWNEDVILSKGVRWSYAPSMSVEGTNVVVVWAGANGLAERTEFSPSDIYYVISKDSGTTWTKPIRVTKQAKSGITSGRPQVMLHKGVIHLVYVQGTLNYQKVSSGMVKLNQPAWPIYYTQRPFPH